MPLLIAVCISFEIVADLSALALGSQQMQPLCGEPTSVNAFDHVAAGLGRSQWLSQSCESRGKSIVTVPEEMQLLQQFFFFQQLELMRERTISGIFFC